MKTFLTISALLPHVVFAEPILLTEEGVKNLGLQSVIVEETDFESTVFALGRTEAIPENRSILSSRIPGRVAESNLAIGTYVEKNEELVLLESRLPGDPPPTIWLKAPANGTIIAVNSSLGAPVEPTDRLAEIADLSTIYLIATVPQSTAGKIKQGTQATVRFPIRPEKHYTATLLKFAACACPDPACALGQDISTRTEKEESADLNTAGVIFTIENPDNQLRPGMTAECTIIMEKREGVMSIPREALHGGPAIPHVYIKHATIPNAFDRVSVRTGLKNKDRIEIIDGLFPSDEVITTGSYSLGYVGAGSGPSLKEAMDAAHGHEHNEDGSEKTPEQIATEKQNNPSEHSRKPSPREFFFMAATAILAILLVISLLRRSHAADPTAEIS